MLKLSLKDEPDLSVFKKVDITSWDNMKANVRLRLINKKFVSQYGDNIPTKNIFNLSYVITVQERDSKKLISHIFTNEELEEYGVTFDEAFEVAKKNTENDTSRRIMPLRDLLMTKENVMAPVCYSPDGEHPLILSQRNMAMIKDINEDGSNNILVLSSSKGPLGSASAFMDRTLSEIYDKFQESFYIVPMSTDEIMYIRESYLLKNGKKPRAYAEDDLLDMVEQMTENLEWKQTLSYKSYLYDDDENVIIMIKR